MITTAKEILFTKELNPTLSTTLTRQVVTQLIALNKASDVSAVDYVLKYT